MAKKPKKTVAQRRLDAEHYSGHWLALGNEYSERGDKANAERCYAKSQRWLDRANLLSNQGDKPAPRDEPPIQHAVYLQTRRGVIDIGS